MFFYGAWLISAFIIFTYLLSLVQDGFALLLFFTTIFLYFDKKTDKKEKALWDILNVNTVIFDILILIVSYQLIQQYGGLALPKISPFGIQIFNNTTY